MSIFQKSVIKNYLADINKDQLEKDYQIFQKNYSPEKIEIIRKLKEEEYQDGFLRDIFVDVLGYTLKPDGNFNLVREFKNQSDGRKADGAILKNNKAKAVIELKSTKTKDLKTITEQAFNYKNNQPDCKYVITSNFQKLRFYIDYAHEYEEFDLFRLNKEDFERMFLILCKESILNDTPEKLKKESISHEESVSKKLYTDYSVFRKKLFENLTRNNPEIDKLILFTKSQKLIDRFLFILFAEDKGLLPSNSINRIIQRFNTLREEDAYKPLYEIYKQYFDYMNTGRKGQRTIDDIPAYNGGLFYPDEVLHNLKIDDDILIDDLQKLSAYDFDTEVDVNILGHIFEHSLSEIEETTARIKGIDVDKNKSKRKKDGIFYTPQYITQYIVENTIGRLCGEKRRELDIEEIEVDDNFYTQKGDLSKKGSVLYQKIEDYKNWLLSLKILDPACGSGAFLNQALNFLIREHNFIIDIQTDLKKGQVSMFNIEAAVLENNLYGVDINEESVEITKLSLWLRTAHKERKLSNLSNTIRCGNSLIDDPEIAGDKAFKWEKEFAGIMENGGFDVIVGNPPYVNVELMPKDEKQFYQKQYATFYKRFDLFGLFIELALKISKRKTGLIIPSQILNNMAYTKLRDLFLENNYLEEACYVGDKVFADANNDVCILFLDKNKNKEIRLIDALEFEKPKTTTVKNDYFSRFQNVISINSDTDSESLFDKIFNPEFVKIDEHFEVFQGIVTGNNPLYIFDKEQLKEVDLENDLLNIVLLGRDFGKWTIKNKTRRMLYLNSKTDIQKYPKTYKWLLPHKEDLKKRRECQKGVIPWYSLQWAREKEKLNTTPKIMVQNTRNPRLETRIVATIDNEVVYALQSVNFIIPKDDLYSVFYLLSILNSKLINYLYKTKFLNVAIKGEYLKQTPMPNISKENQQPFIEKADIMLTKNKELHELKADFFNFFKSELTPKKISKKLEKWNELDWNQFKKEMEKCKVKDLSLKERKEWQDYFIENKEKADKIKFVIDSTDKEIDRMVYELYGLTQEEIEIVEKTS